MAAAPETPLEPPPRKAHFRRVVRNLRRGYSTAFVLLIVVFAGWAALAAIRWYELTSDEALKAIGFALSALLAFLIWRLVDLPLRRELRLARRGEVARGQIVSLRQSRGRRPAVFITYSFTTAAGEALTRECKLPRRSSTDNLGPGFEIEILYDPRNPRINKPRLGLEFVDFGPTNPGRQGPGGT